jgi:hypothetical protein
MMDDVALLDPSGQVSVSTQVMLPCHLTVPWLVVGRRRLTKLLGTTTSLKKVLNSSAERQVWGLEP